jgi:hypothetical protein
VAQRVPSGPDRKTDGVARCADPRDPSAARHSSLGGEFGERIDPVKDARLLARIEAASPIMLGPEINGEI